MTNFHIDLIISRPDDKLDARRAELWLGAFMKHRPEVAWDIQRGIPEDIMEKLPRLSEKLKTCSVPIASFPNNPFVGNNSPGHGPGGGR
jgi:hypothetical protein